MLLQLQDLDGFDAVLAAMGADGAVRLEIYLDLTGSGASREDPSATPESLCALVQGVHQWRTDAGGQHRPASASHGRRATLLKLYFPETKKSEGKIYSFRHDAGPSGSSPAPVSVLWRSNSTATFRRGAELEGPDCFSHNLSGVFSVKTQTFFQNSPVL
jgi:cytolysin (calcineurin-like family phosphatase)